MKTAKKRSHSSTLWLERQLNDPYVARAKREGYRSRAAYKLIEIDDKLHFLKPGARVVDLGAAPGGWSQVAAKRVGAQEDKGRVVAIDILEMGAIPGVDFMRAGFPRSDSARPPERKTRRARGRRALRHGRECHRPPADRSLKIMALVEAAAEFAKRGACPGRRLRRESLARRNRERIVRRAQARFRDGEACEARSQPLRIHRNCTWSQQGTGRKQFENLLDERAKASCSLAKSLMP